MKRRMLAVAAAISMVAGSTAAMAQSAAPLSIAPSMRAGESTEDASQLGTTAVIIFAVVIAGLLVLVLSGGDNSDSP